MNRIRRIKHDNFMTISNEIFRNPAISLKAKGLHAMVMGLPNDWDFSIAGLVSISREGKHAVYTILNELIAAGYARRERIYENGKIAAWNYVFIECLSDQDLLSKNLEVENLEIENLDLGNQPQLSKQLIKDTKNQVRIGDADPSALRASGTRETPQPAPDVTPYTPLPASAEGGEALCNGAAGRGKRESCQFPVPRPDVDSALWAEWLAMRVKLKKPLTSHGYNRLIADLGKLVAFDLNERLEIAIDRKWLGLIFAEDKNGGRPINGQPAQQQKTGIIW